MSYSQAELVARRIVAYGACRATPLARAFAQGADPDLSIGVAIIKIVTEEQIQAIAFGPIDEPPQVIARLDPLSRDVSDLAPFATFMANVGSQAVGGADVRLWTPHQSAMEAIDLLGHRYATNKEAPAIVNSMGVVCRAFGAQLRHAGQPIVACAHEQLIAHFVSGQSAAEDRHLAAFLAWIESNGDPNVFDLARVEALLPASGILPNTPAMKHDSRVEVLRRIAKNAKYDIERDAARAEMRHLLEAAVLREWGIMQRARAALVTLPDTSLPDAGASGEAHERLRYHLGGGAFRAAQPHAIALELKRLEKADGAAAQRGWRSDPMRRDAAVRRGRIIQGEIVSVEIYTRGTRPLIEISTRQPIVRFRIGAELSPLDLPFNIAGEIESMGVGATDDERIIGIRVTGGMTFTNQAFSVGDVCAWEAKDVDLIIRETQMSKHIAQRAPWVLSGAAPADSASTLPAGDLVQAANALVKP
jgi:hypothetical protein